MIRHYFQRAAAGQQVQWKFVQTYERSPVWGGFTFDEGSRWKKNYSTGRICWVKYLRLVKQYPLIICLFRHSGTPAIACAYKNASGLLYPLERGFMYVHKPPIHVRFEEISCVNFARSDVSTRSFDFEIETKTATTHTFTNIEKWVKKPCWKPRIFHLYLKLIEKSMPSCSILSLIKNFAARMSGSDR